MGRKLAEVNLIEPTLIHSTASEALLVALLVIVLLYELEALCMHGGGSGPNDIHRSGMKELQTVCMTKEYKTIV